jgi:hypothetical protein
MNKAAKKSNLVNDLLAEMLAGPPTIREVREWTDGRVDLDIADKCYRFLESKGWGPNLVENWQAFMLAAQKRMGAK